jgi:aryl-alcohol dehydrogenase-like predicted oxidoreductase
VQQRSKYLAPQYTSPSPVGGNNPIKVNFVGNSLKHLHVSVEASLKRLRTSYIDILYLHWWDFTASVKEVMDALHHLVADRKVLYLVSVLSSG